jgi:hypothetical protein
MGNWSALNLSQKKLLFIVNSTLIGGHEMQARNIVKDYLAANIDVVVLCPNEEVRNFFFATGATVEYLPFSIEGRLWKQVLGRKVTAKLLASSILDFKEVIVSGGSIEATINPVMAIKLLNPKVHVTSYVPMYIDRSITHGLIGRIYNCILNYVAKVTDDYVTVNRIQAHIIKKRTGIHTNYIYNRVRSVQMPKRTFGPRLIYVGRFDNKQKDITGLLKLLDHPNNPYENMILIGDGPDREIILDAANHCQYLKVEIRGWLNADQIDDSTGTEDVLILNSLWEGEPLVVMEFLAKGLTCIAKDIAGVRGVIDKKLRFRNQSDLLSILNNIHPYSCVTVKQVE